MRRKLTSLLILLSLTVLLYPPAAPSAPDGKAARPIRTLSVMLPYRDATETAALADLAKAFEREYPQAEVQVKFCPREDYWKAIPLDYSRQTLSDFVVMDNVMIPAFCKLGVIASLDGYLEGNELREDTPEKLTENVMVGDACYGIPFTCYTYALFYNLELLDKYQCAAPRDWAQLIDVCERMIREPADRFAIAAAPGEALTNQFLQLMYSADGAIRDLKGSGAMQAYQLLAEMTEKRLIAKDCVNWNEADLTRKFASREVAMMINSSSQAPFLRQLDPEFEWGVAAVPSARQGKNVFSGESVVFTRDTLDEDCRAFLDYLTSPSVSSLYTQLYGSLPVRGEGGGEGGRDIFQKQLDAARPLPMMTQWQNISRAVQDSIMRVLEGESPVERIARETYTRVNAYIIDG